MYFLRVDPQGINITSFLDLPGLGFWSILAKRIACDIFDGDLISQAVHDREA
jgi:hypothetical protein